MRSLRLASVIALLALGSSCVTETLPEGPPRELPRILDLPGGALPAGFYHGVQLFFELSQADAPDAIQWMLEDASVRQLPPIVPEIEPGGREIYRVRDVHEVSFHHDMFETGGYRYPRMQGARLYVFKKRPGNFSLGFRGQGIVVPSDVPWSPSIYYYSEEEDLSPDDRSRKRRTVVTREILQIGLATIETLPKEGLWLVNGRKYVPDTSRPLELDGAVHARVAR